MWGKAGEMGNPSLEAPLLREISGKKWVGLSYPLLYYTCFFGGRATHPLSQYTGGCFKAGKGGKGGRGGTV